MHWYSIMLCFTGPQVEVNKKSHLLAHRTSVIPAMSASSAAATNALVAAARRLDVDAMRARIAVGGKLRDTTSFSYGRLSLAAVVVIGEKADGAADIDASQKAALRLLGEHGGLSPTAATSALPYAARHDRSPAVVQLLLDAGADVNIPAGDGCTALHCVHSAAVAWQLLGAGASVNASGPRGRTPLHYAVRLAACHQRAAVVEALLRGGAAPNAVDVTDRTPLARAIGEHPPWELAPVDVVETLLQGGADPAATDASGRSVRAIAAQWLNGCVRDLPTLQSWRSVLASFQPHEAWLRRRHLLVVVRGRHYAPVDATAGAAAAVGDAGDTAATILVGTGDGAAAGESAPVAAQVVATVDDGSAAAGVAV